MPSIPTRKIGNDEVPEMGLGLMGLSAWYGQVGSDEERFEFLDTALEDGWTFWDSADIYGDSEDLVGKWFKRTGNRDKIFLATKFGIDRSEGGRGVNGTPEYAKSACAKSLRRLGIDQIDLYYLHRPDPMVPIEKTVGAMAELVKEGKVRYLGLSEVSSATLRRAHAVHPISAVQVEYSPFTLDIEDEKIGLLKTCRELGIAVIAYSPLGRGLLTGQYKSPDDFEEAMAELVKEGKVRYLGLSEVSSATLRRAHAVHPISAVQVEYSPFTLDIEDEKIGLLKTCRELGIAVIAYSPLGRGLLTGQYKSPDDFEEGDLRGILPRFSRENFPKILQITDGLAEIAKKHNATVSQVTLAWVLAQGKDVIPIPGTKKIKYLKENLGAINITLSDEEIAKIRKLAQDSEIMQVERYPAQFLAACFADTPPL